MNRNPTIWIGAVIALLGGAVCGADEVFPVLHGDPIAVRVLDGKDGNPQARTRVVLTAGYDRRDLKLAQWREELLTDSAGIVQLSNALRNLPLLQVEVLNRHGCAPGAENAALSVERIRESGLSGANRCGTAVAENAPGVLTVFVKGMKGASKPVLKAGLPANLSKTPSLPAGSVAEPRPVAVASSVTSSKAPPEGDSEQTYASQQGTPAPDAHVPEWMKTGALEQATSSADAAEDASPPDPFVDFAIGSLGLDAPPAGGPAPQTGQRAGHSAAVQTPAKRPAESARGKTPGTSDSSPVPAKTPGHTSHSPSTAAPASAPADRPSGSARTAAEPLDQFGASSKASPSNVAHSRPTSALSAVPGQAAAADSPAGIGHVDAASARPAKAQANPSVNTVPHAVNGHAVQLKRVPATGLDRVSAPSDAQAHGAASAAVRAASGAASRPRAQAPAAPPLSHGPNSTSAPEHFRVRLAAPAAAPPTILVETPDEEDLNSLCEPG
jgi:hypothetical protein